MWQAKIHITLKQGVLDPQGAAVAKSLQTLGYNDVNDVRVGKYMLVELAEASKEAATVKVEEMCHKLLANPVIEEYQYELIEV